MIKVNLTHNISFRDSVKVNIRISVSIRVNIIVMASVIVRVNYKISNMVRVKFMVRVIVLWLYLLQELWAMVSAKKSLLEGFVMVIITIMCHGYVAG